MARGVRGGEGDTQPTRRVGLFGMVVIGFFWVCGGMYGNGELLGTAPPALVLLALIVVPFSAACTLSWPPRAVLYTYMLLQITLP